jgi:hypothetical protein
MLSLCEDVGATSCSYTLLLQLDVGLYFSVYPNSVIIKDILLIVSSPDSFLFHPLSPLLSFWYDPSIIDPHILTIAERSQVFPPQMPGPSGSIFSSVAVRVVWTQAFQEVLAKAYISWPNLLSAFLLGMTSRRTRSNMLLSFLFPP